MANNRTPELLSFANVQMASEAFLGGLPAPAAAEYRDEALRRLQRGNTHASIFPKTVADEFLNDWDIVAHEPNTLTGFSATLFEPGGPTPAVGSFRANTRWPSARLNSWTMRYAT